MFSHLRLVIRSLVIGSFLWPSFYGNQLNSEQVSDLNILARMQSHNSSVFSLAGIQANKSYKTGDISQITFSEFKTLKDFTKALATKENYAFLLMRMVASEISASSFNHFRIDFMPSAEGVKLVFSNTSSTTDGVSIYSPYERTPDFAFEDYLNQKNEAAVYKSSAHTVSFSSYGGNMLVIPRGNYVNFYDFSLNAKAEEILDFWKHVDMLMKEFDAEQFDLASHAGSEAAQTVFHFHLRFEFHDKATRKRIADYALDKYLDQKIAHDKATSLGFEKYLNQKNEHDKATRVRIKEKK